MDENGKCADGCRRKPALQELNGYSISAAMHTGTGLPSPFMRDIYLKKQAIVGIRFQGGYEELLKLLKNGSRITFLRETDNRFDGNAVMAINEDGQKLGYVPRYENEILCSLLDAGKHLYGLVNGGRPDPGGEARRYPSIDVDLYMREFSLPGDLEEIPRQGYLASYALTYLEWKKEKGKERLTGVFAIKVINGEEREVFSKKSEKGASAEKRRSLIKEFFAFVGYLPLVGHGISGEDERKLADQFGVMLGKPLSNRIIDTLVMARNHLDFRKDYSLASLTEELGIEAGGDSEAEVRCRQTWELYKRMERSELDRGTVHFPPDPEKQPDMPEKRKMIGQQTKK